MSKSKLCLVTGASGYIGGRLIPDLLAKGYRVRVLARNARRLQEHSWVKQVEVIEGDAFETKVVENALNGVDVAYYLMHSLMEKNDFESQEMKMADIFGKAASKQKVGRIVYLGGIVPAEAELSPHMSARANTGKILRESGVPTLELRAGIVIGSGSASFEMLRHLTERLPFMITPKWLNIRIQPIAVRDVLHYLVGAASVDKKVSGSFDIGGPDVFSYKTMMQKYAEAAGLRKRIIVPVPVMTPKLSSGWVGLVTPVPYTLARRLVASLKNEVVVGDDRIRKLIPDPEGGLTTFKRAVELALVRIKDNQVETRWSDASIPWTPSDPLPTDPQWAGGSVYKDVRKLDSKDALDVVWKRIEAIGGDNGYSTATWAWELRGLADKVTGGVGLRRGRRDPDHLQVGDALDFWRVEKVDRPKTLRLRAEMRMPGLAWLEFVVEPDAKTGGCKITQTATYAPKGLMGHLYWWSVWPMHGIVFPSMIRHIARG
ncbi:unannotated protein [freshwater metagenome]|uniref:Unannotated protein n=1 Tax=freshwater metagenome TaxID=449393 RepID=A0A6J7JYL1_9ZZZZ|nr:DUF2867 domain-containing protein [Actinomycetota bacterium]